MTTTGMSGGWSSRAEVDVLARMTLDVTADSLRECCAARAWIAAVEADGPYASLEALQQRSDAALAQLTEADVDEALAAHPRIGRRAEGASREASWSRQEQSGAAQVDDDVRQALAAGNAEYEDRFGRVFLICATGLSAQHMLAVQRDRLTHDEETERTVVREELRKIVRLRLAKAFPDAGQVRA